MYYGRLMKCCWRQREFFSLDVDSIGSVPMQCLGAFSNAENKPAAAVMVSYQDLKVVLCLQGFPSLYHTYQISIPPLYRVSARLAPVGGYGRWGKVDFYSSTPQNNPLTIPTHIYPTWCLCWAHL